MAHFYLRDAGLSIETVPLNRMNERKQMGDQYFGNTCTVEHKNKDSLPSTDKSNASPI